jgi:hypothetical protein
MLVEVFATGFGYSIADQRGGRWRVQLDQAEAAELLRLSAFRLTSRILTYVAQHGLLAGGQFPHIARVDLSTFLRLFGSMQLRVKGMKLTKNDRR